MSDCQCTTCKYARKEISRTEALKLLRDEILEEVKILKRLKNVKGNILSEDPDERLKGCVEFNLPGDLMIRNEILTKKLEDM